MKLKSEIIDSYEFRLESQVRRDLGECRQHVYFLHNLITLIKTSAVVRYHVLIHLHKRLARTIV